MNMKRLTIDEMQTIAIQRGGECLSSKYVNGQTKLKWKCSEGHVWMAIPYSIKRGSWCPVCSKKRAGSSQRLSIEHMHKLAMERNGECLSSTYVNAHTKLKWKCSKGHIFEAEPNNIKYNRWCPICGHKKQGIRARSTIEDMQKLAAERGGECLSETYANAHKKLKWKCSKGHIFEAKPNTVQQGQWCPECNSFKSERLCRMTLEQLFEKPFPKSRPTWLINREGNRMELDGYNKELGIAFEYNGEQHLELNHFSPTQEILDKRIRDDWDKADLCHQHNIKLLVITCRFNLDALPQIIEMQLTRLGFDTSKINFTKTIDFSEFYNAESKTTFRESKVLSRKASHPNQQDLGI